MYAAVSDVVHPIFAKKGSQRPRGVARYVEAIGGESATGAGAGDNAIMAEFRALVHGVWAEDA